MCDNDKKFSYTYTAPTESERREIEDIQKQYMPSGGADKIARLRKLNARVKNAAMCTALTLGVVGVLLFGAGMSLVLVWATYIGGIISAVAGIAATAAAHPVYNAVLKKCKAKYGKEILRLSQELLDGRG